MRAALTGQRVDLIVAQLDGDAHRAAAGPNFMPMGTAFAWHHALGGIATCVTHVYAAQDCSVSIFVMPNHFPSCIPGGAPGGPC